jgi:nucleoside-diphosphate-sugar epimerase
MPKALITGGSGYFGSLLLNRLLERGYECAILDINEYEGLPTNVRFFQADIRNREAVSRSCRGMDVVFHNVAQVPLAKDSRLFDSVNRQGTEILLASALANSVSKVIYTSSSAVFGVPERNPVTESIEPRPMEKYGEAKLQGEKCCHAFKEKGLDVTIIRPRTIMGHGRLGIFQILFEWVRTGYNIPVLGGGKNVYQFVHADDLAEACVLAMKPGPDTYNCGTDLFGTMREVLEDLCVYANTGSKVVSLPMGPIVLGMEITSKLGLSPLGAYHSLMYGRSMYFDISKAKNDLGWQPKYSNNEMFRESYDWYLKNHQKITTGAQNRSHHRSGMKQGVLSILRYFLKMRT